MGLVLHVFLAVALACGSYLAYVSYVSPTDEVRVEENGWFGEGEVRPDDLSVYPFEVNVTPDALQDLKLRLERSRISHTHLEDSDDFWYGFNSNELEVFRQYWLKSYDWKKHEKIINQFRQFKTEIEGVKIAFEVVAPSIPGYGWSDQPKRSGFSQVACARVFRKLMERLDIKKFYLQGGDWGALVTSNLAKLYPAQVFGLHLNMLAALPDASLKVAALEIFGSFFPKWVFSSASHHNYNLFATMAAIITESGYMHIQATKPDTVGDSGMIPLGNDSEVFHSNRTQRRYYNRTALNDSPIGLAAYILEKFSTWTNSDHRALADGGLTNLIATILSRILPGRSEQSFTEAVSCRSDCTLFCIERVSFDRTPPEISSVLYNLTHYTEAEDVGHFAAFEMPRPLAVDIFDFVKKLER
ncbi:hydrolase, alpha/beta domain protein, partial [Ostertagia ostertagi]